MSDHKPSDPHKESFTHADEAALESEKEIAFGPGPWLQRTIGNPVAWLALLFFAGSLIIGRTYSPQWTAEIVALDIGETADGKFYYIYKEKQKYIPAPIPYETAKLLPDKIKNYDPAPPLGEEFVFKQKTKDDPKEYFQIKAKKHYGIWSLFPALVAITMCWIIREPVSSLFAGVVSGALLIKDYNIADQILLPTMMTESAAGVILLYLVLLGGLLGIWSRTGAAQAFADFMTRHFVRGPRSAKLVAWLLGLIFFQGGTISTVLVGTTVKPIADKENISHEELSYIVDSTASPIAILLAFNAWPGYIQAFMFVAGVGFLQTEADRLTFFFGTIPLNFYAIFAVLGTFLLSIDKAPYLGPRMRRAIERARTTGELDAPGAQPLTAKELSSSDVPEGYKPHVADFLAPLLTLLFIAVGSFFYTGTPEVRTAFGIAVLLAIFMALFRGMGIQDLVYGLGEGFKGAVLGSIILLLAISLGYVSNATGGGTFLVEMFGDSLPYIILPIIFLVLTVVIAFSTGSSWGTYAVALPLAMPLSWAVAQSQGLGNPELFMMVCFASVLNGSVIGDQLSPISDTTILSSMCTGCDLMDHVQSQIPPAAFAAGLAAIAWTLVIGFFA